MAKPWNTITHKSDKTMFYRYARYTTKPRIAHIGYLRAQKEGGSLNTYFLGAGLRERYVSEENEYLSEYKRIIESDVYD